MVSEPLLSRIENFLQEIGEEYKLVEDVSQEDIVNVMNNFIPAIIALPQERKEDILNELERSWRQNQDHNHYLSDLPYLSADY